MTTSILAGDFKGLKLFTGESASFRPTLSRVRQSLFNMLPDISGWEVLDLFAGAGTLGFEALSRGAKSVVFIEKNLRAVTVLQRNSRLFSERSCLKDRNISVIKKDVFRFLQGGEDTFDLIFADPPYGKVDLDSLKQLSMKRLNSDGFLVIESSVRGKWTPPDARIKRYGETCLIIFPRFTSSGRTGPVWR